MRTTIGIPCYNVDDETIRPLLHSIRAQGDVEIIAYGDGDGRDYDIVKEFGGKVIKGKTNMGPGVARQKILEACKTEFITFADADDILSMPYFIRNAEKALDADKTIVQVGYTFLQIEEDGNFVPHERDQIWVFGKVYRMSFIRKYDIHFPDFRSNEDTCWNLQISLIATTQQERIVYFKDVCYFWQFQPSSITRTKLPDGKNAYSNDACFHGWLASTTHAVNHARKYRPFSGEILEKICVSLLQAYFYHMKCIADTPFFARQQWFYIKKFYHEVYEEIGRHISEEALAEIYSVLNVQNSQSMIRVIPAMGIREFLDKLKTDSYDENEIYGIWDAMYHEHPEIMEENVRCGVMPKNYWRKPSNMTIEKKRRK